MLKYTPIRRGVYKDTDPWYIRWYWNTYRFFRWNVRYWHKDIANGVKNLYMWFPIIWRDRNWDQQYLLDMMMFKMSLMGKGLKLSTPQATHMKELRYCVRLLKEYSRRSQCDCRLLGSKKCGSKNMKAYMRCLHEQEQILAEFGDVFARNVQHWWD